MVQDFEPGSLIRVQMRYFESVTNTDARHMYCLIREPRDVTVDCYRYVEGDNKQGQRHHQTITPIHNPAGRL